jgi:hypothetical protein
MRDYADDSLNAVQQLPLKGNDSTTLLLTPQAGTGAETKTHTTTLKTEVFGRKVVIKRLLYLVETAQTGAGNNLTLDVYKNTTSSGSLSVTTETALTVCTSSALDIEMAKTDYLRVLALSRTTASDANSAKGNLIVLYGERYESGV